MYEENECSPSLSHVLGVETGTLVTAEQRDLCVGCCGSLPLSLEPILCFAVQCGMFPQLEQ